MGTLWHRSGTVERYADDLRAVGAKAYFFIGNTVAPFTVYANSGETSAHPHPVVADANGRWPDIFIPFTPSYSVRVTSADDVELTFTKQVPNPIPGGGGDGTPSDVQANMLVDVGMIFAEFVGSPAIKTGFVRLNGRTIGNSLSSASEMAHQDCRALFIHIWSNVPDAMAPLLFGGVPSERTTPINDWRANKQLTLPDMRGVGFMGLDDMGSSPAGRYTGQTFQPGGNSVFPASILGSNTVQLTTTNLPSHTHTGNTDNKGTTVGHSHTGGTGGQSAAHQHVQTGTFTSTGESAAHNHLVPELSINTNNFGPPGGGQPFVLGLAYTSPSANVTANNTTDHTHNVTLSGPTGIEVGVSGTSGTHTHPIDDSNLTSFSFSWSHAHAFTTDSAGSGTAFSNIPFARLVTWYISLGRLGLPEPP